MHDCRTALCNAAEVVFISKFDLFARVRVVFTGLLHRFALIGAKNPLLKLDF